MNQDNKLKQAFMLGLGLPENTDFESLEFAKSEKWDSIAHMKLVSAIEEMYSIRLDVSDILAMNSFKTACEILKRYAVTSS